MQQYELFDPSAIDPGRLERGLGLRGERVGPGRYRFVGGSDTHWVDLTSPSQPRCDCADHLWRDSICKHILAALIREGDEHVLAAVGELVRAMRAA